MSLAPVFRECPHTETTPAVGFSVVVNIFIVVLFPAPLGPTNPSTDPAETEKLSESRAVKPL